MPLLLQSTHTVGDLRLDYRASADHPDAWGLVVYPSALAGRVVTPREWLDSPAVKALPTPWNAVPAWDHDPLVHLHVVGQPWPGGLAQGRTLRHAAPTREMAVRRHEAEHRDGTTLLRTTADAPGGLRCIHELTADGTTGVLEIRTSVENVSDVPVTLDFLTSFSLGGITPFAADDAPGRLVVHRFRSGWSAEGRHDLATVESLHLERSWTGHGPRSERFGQSGSLPVNGWFPLVGLEDRGAGVTWLAQLACPGSWHIEIYRRADQLSLSGGGADRLSGEWLRTLQPGERFSAPPAYLTAVAGTIDDACDRLLAAQRARTVSQPPIEQKLPVIFNEWCTSWGHPTHENVVKLADRLAGSGITYLVIDDGWAERPGDAFQQNGDWRVNRHAFPGGLRATADAVRARGLIPGLWFEFEAINPGSEAWNETAHQLHRDGVPLEVGARRFWDFRDPWVHDFLAERVIARLRDDGLGYLKIDCNDSIGPGVDGPQAPGENLRLHLEGVQRFLARLRAELPGLVIENCASGGHRLEASTMALTAMSSFSDAHETPALPIIAANLNRLVWSAQKQIWAVPRKEDSLERLSYSLAAGFLGRLCVSGEIAALSEEAWAFVREGVAFYREVAPLIRDGVFRCERRTGDSWQHLTGEQLVTVRAPSGNALLVVWHRFGGIAAPSALPLPQPARWRLARAWGSPVLRPRIHDGLLAWEDPGPWTGGVLLLEADADGSTVGPAE